MRRNRNTRTESGGEEPPGKVRRRVFEGGPTYRRKPVKSVGRYTAERYCARCGHVKARCICRG